MKLRLLFILVLSFFLTLLLDNYKLLLNRVSILYYFTVTQPNNNVHVINRKKSLELSGQIAPKLKKLENISSTEVSKGVTFKESKEDKIALYNYDTSRMEFKEMTVTVHGKKITVQVPKTGPTPPMDIFESIYYSELQ